MVGGGALERLLWNGLQPGTYSHREQEVGARLAPEHKETILLFQLDEPYDELRAGMPAGTRICDGLFFYRRRRKSPPWLLFFELKRGEDFEHAVSQLVSAIALLTQDLHARCDERQIHAVVVSGAQAPGNRQVLQKWFRQQMRAIGCRASLGFVVCPLKDVTDLRPELHSRIEAKAKARRAEERKN